MVLRVNVKQPSCEDGDQIQQTDHQKGNGQQGIQALFPGACKVQTIFNESKPEITAAGDGYDGDRVDKGIEEAGRMDQPVFGQRPEKVGCQHTQIGVDHIPQLAHLVLRAQIAVEPQPDGCGEDDTVPFGNGIW